MQNQAPSPIELGMIVGSWLPYSETFIYDQIQHQQRFRSTVYCRDILPSAKQFPYEDLVSLSSIESALFSLSGFAPRYARRLKERNAKLIHAHFGLNGAFIAPLCERLDLPLAVTFHGHDVGGLFPQNRYNRHFALYQQKAPRMFEYAQLLICASTELAEQLESLGAPSSKLVVHRLGIDLQHFRRTQDADPGFLRVLIVGRFVEKKGIGYGIQAFARAAKEFPEARLDIVGEGPLRDELQSMVHALDMDQKVKFWGRRSAAEVREHMQAAQLLIAPSVVAKDGDRESGILVLKEAAAMGLATVGTRHGGIVEIIDDEETGLLVEERDVEGLYQALAQLFLDPSLRQRMGRMGRQKMEREYDTVQQNQALEELLARLLPASNPSQ